jgi:hypothetical protein
MATPYWVHLGGQGPGEVSTGPMVQLVELWPASGNHHQAATQRAGQGVVIFLSSWCHFSQSFDHSHCHVRCLQEITYLTSPQAMNPLPNRPLLNASAPLSLPNPVEQMGFNGRPRKVLLEAGKDYPSINGTAPVTGPSSTASTTPGPQLPLLDRSAGGLLQPALQSQHATGSLPQPGTTGVSEKDRGEDLERSQLTAIFRPDEEWKEKFRSEQAKQLRDGQATAVSVWDRRRDDDDDVRDEESELEEDESTMVTDGETTKNWKAKRTLRKLVVLVGHINFVDKNHLSVIWML